MLMGWSAGWWSWWMILSAALRCGGEHRTAELVFANSLRATKREEQAAFLDETYALGVETDITLQGVVQGCAMLGKGRWVEHNDVVFVFLFLQETERVLAIGFVARVARKVQ